MILRILLCVGLSIYFMGCHNGKDDDTLSTQTSVEKILSLTESELKKPVYDVIVGSDEATIAQKNAIIIAVKDAMKKVPKNQQTRDNSITAAVNAHGNHAGLAERIKREVDRVDPITVVEEELISLAESELAEEIYTIITDAEITAVDKNRIILAVKAVILESSDDQDERDNAIAVAVMENGGTEELIQPIQDQVDILHPIVDEEEPVLTTQTVSELELTVYNVIINYIGLSILQKNAMLVAVKNAVERNANNQLERDNAILVAAPNTGVTAGLAALIKIQVDLVRPIPLVPVLTTQGNSGLALAIYEVITGHPGLSIGEKNAMLVAVRNAIANNLNNQVGRDAAILLAAPNAGTTQDLADLIKAQVNIAHPIVDPPVLVVTAQDVSGLAQVIYDVIASHTVATVEHKNALLVAVKNAIDNHPADLEARNNAIDLAVTNNGNYENLATNIKGIINITHAIVEAVLKTESESGLGMGVYTAIASHVGTTTYQKNNIMTGVKTAMVRKAKALRDRYIVKAVNNPALQPLAQDIITAADNALLLGNHFEAKVLPADQGSDPNGNYFVVKVTKAHENDKNINVNDELYLKATKLINVDENNDIRVAARTNKTVYVGKIIYFKNVRNAELRTLNGTERNMREAIMVQDVDAELVE